MPALPDRSIALIYGTRPEQIKLSVLTSLLGAQARLIHTGQHYDPNLDLSTGDQAQPHLRLAVGGQPRGVQVGIATAQLTRHFETDPPRAVLVQGDTNSALAGALAANATNIPLIHIEAGLRSRDRSMPEEHNRILIDHLADHCCAATPSNAANLWAEGIDADRITLTGNTIIEAVHLTPRDPPSAAAALGAVAQQSYILATLHRPENTDAHDRLADILTALAALDHPVILPLHPRTRDRAHQYGLGPLLRQITVTTPLTYPTFLTAAEHAALLISDSGGIQEEASVLRVPLIVLRRSTERPEALGDQCVLTNDPAQLHHLARTHTAARSAHGTSPFGDGRASARIADLVQLIATGPGHAAQHRTSP